MKKKVTAKKGKKVSPKKVAPKKAAIKKPIKKATKKPAPKKVKKPAPKKAKNMDITHEELFAFYGQFGKVNSIGNTLLDENRNFSSKGEKGFHVSFEDLKDGSPLEIIPKEYRGARVKVQVIGKIRALHAKERVLGEDDGAWDQPLDEVWDDLRRAPVATKAFAKQVTKFAKEIKMKLQPGRK